MSKPKRPAPGKTSAWHAVSIIAGPQACAAAQAFGLRRFLSGAAPRLPLAECTQSDRCQCRYRHHADRRAGGRRADDERVAGAPGARAKPADGERRRPGERRARD